MAFKPKNALEQSLVRAASKPESLPAFYRTLAAADLLIVRHGAFADRPLGDIIIPANEGVSIESVERDGIRYLLVFSSVARLQAIAPGGVPYLALKALDLMELTQGRPLLLNRDSKYERTLSQEEIASIMELKREAAAPRR